MAYKLYNEESVRDIADALREKLEVEDTFTIGEMGGAVRGIETGEDVTDEVNIQTPLVAELKELVATFPDEEGGTFTISLPIDFVNANDIYWVKLDKDKYLISADNPSNIGVWLYTKSTNSIEQKYIGGTKWSRFQTVGNNCLITSSSGDNIDDCKGVLVYNATDNTITKQYNNGLHLTNFKVIGDKCLIASGFGNYTLKGVLVYNASNNTIALKYDKNYSWSNYLQISDTKYLIGGEGTSYGLLLYNDVDESIVNIYPDGGYWGYFQRVTDTRWLIGGSGSGILIFNSENDTAILAYSTGSYWRYFQNVSETKCLISSYMSNTGILLYNSETDTIEQKYTNLYQWYYFQQVGNDWLITGNYTGILLYEGATDTITLKYSDSYRRVFQPIGNNCLIGSNYQNAKGLLLYKSEDKTVIQIHSDGQQLDAFQVVSDTKCIVSGYTGGVLLYNDTDNSITQKYSRGYRWTTLHRIGNDCIITSTNDSGVLIYNDINETITLQHNTGYYWRSFIDIDNTRCLITSIITAEQTTTSGAGLGVLLYNSNNKTLSHIYSNGYNYDEYKLDGKKYYLQSSNISFNGRKLSFNSDDDTITLIGYTIGEV